MIIFLRRVEKKQLVKPLVKTMAKVAGQKLLAKDAGLKNLLASMLVKTLAKVDGQKLLAK
jgi:hypothetical protein